MQNIIQKFRQNFIVSWKIENFDELQLPETNNFVEMLYTFTTY